MLNSRLLKLELMLLSDESKKIDAIYSNVIKIIQNQSLNKKELASELARIHYIYLLKLIQKDERIATFCQQDDNFQKLIKQKLKSSGHPDFDLESLDKKLQYTILELYIAASILSNIKPDQKANESKSLNQACELGLYAALIIRCKNNERILLNESESHESKTKALQILLADVQMLAKLYASLGYIRGGCFLNTIGNSFLERTDSADKTQGIFLYEESIKYFLCAQMLFEDKYSQVVIENMLNGKSVFSLFENINFKLNSWEDVKYKLKEWTTNFEVLENRAKLEIKPIPLKENATGENKDKNSGVLNNSNDNEICLMKDLELADIYLKSFTMETVDLSEQKASIMNVAALRNLISAALLLNEAKNNYGEKLLKNKFYNKITNNFFTQKSIDLNNWIDIKNYCLTVMNENDFNAECETAKTIISKFKKSL